MSSTQVPAAVWRDEAVALVINEVIEELPEADADAVRAAATRCRAEVPVLSGLPLLRHRIRQRVLGLPILAGFNPV